MDQDCSVKTIIKKELFDTLSGFVNELELCFNLDKSITNSLKEYIKSISGEKVKNKKEFEKFLEYTYAHLNTFESNLSLILFSKRKLKSADYNFLKNIRLFNLILNFNTFENESKSTKKSLIQYLYNLYMCCSFLNIQTEVSTDAVNEFVNRIQNEATSTNTVAIAVKPTPQTLISRSGVGDSNGLSDLMGNSDIMKIATDIAEQMKNEDINPMALMTSLMSGNTENGPLKDIIAKIQSKVDKKVSDGEINKEDLESQAKNILNNVNSSEFKNIPGLSDMFNNLNK